MSKKNETNKYLYTFELELADVEDAIANCKYATKNIAEDIIGVMLNVPDGPELEGLIQKYNKYERTSEILESHAENVIKANKFEKTVA